MVASKANIGLLFDVQALAAQNEVNRKQTEKRRRQVKADEQLQEVADKTASKVKKQKANSKDLISRRRASQMAMSKLSAKNAAKKAAKSEDLVKSENEAEQSATQTEKETNTEKKVDVKTKTTMEAEGKEANIEKAAETTELVEAKPAQKAETAETTELAEAKPAQKAESEEAVEAVKGENNFFSEEEIQSAKNVFKDINNLQQKMAAEGKQEYVLDFDASTKDIIDDMFKPENLIGCEASEEELAAVKKEVLENSRLCRRIATATLPYVEVAAKQEVASMGIDLTDPKQNPYLKDKDGNLVNANPVPYFAGTSLKSKYFSVREEDETEETDEKSSSEERKDIDQSMFACIFRSIEMNQLLHELGIKTEISQGRIQKLTSKDLVKEAQKQFKKTADEIEKAKKQEKCNKIMKIVGIVFAVILTPIAPAIGIPLLLASTGALDKMITLMAKAFGVPEYVIQSIIAVAALIIATVVSIICPPAAPMAFGYAIFIAGLTGWIENTIGVIATGQTDPEKFPEWVAWAAIGVEIGLSLATAGSGIVNSIRSMGTGLMKVGLAGAKVGAKVGLVSSRTVATIGARVATRTATQAARIAATSATKTARVAAKAASTAARQASKAAAVAAKAAKSGLTAEAKAASALAKEASKVAEAAAAKAVEAASKASTAATKAATASVKASTQVSSKVSLSSNQISKAVESAVNTATQGARSAASAATSSVQGISTTAAISSGTTANTAAIRSEISSIEKSLASIKDSKALAGIPAQGIATSSSSASTRASTLAKTASTQTKFERMMEKAQQIIEKYIKKLLAKIYSAKGAASDASALASMAKGASSASKKAERAYQILVKLMRLSKQFARWMQLAHQGATAVAQIEMARMKQEIGDLLEEAAQITGEIHLLEQFLSTFGMAVKSTQEQKKQYAQDSAEAVQTLGEVIAIQRRANTMLMSA